MTIWVDIKDKSTIYTGRMFLVELYGPCISDRIKEIDTWMKENISSFDCIKYGRTYLMDDEVSVMAVRLKWEEI